MRGAADARIEEALLARVAKGPADVLDLLAAARAVAGDPLAGREGAIHAILLRLRRSDWVHAAGHAASGAALYALPDAAVPSPSPLAPPAPASVRESRLAISVARGVREPEARGRVVADVLAHIAALRAAGRERDFGPAKSARVLLARVDRGRFAICAPIGLRERLLRFAVEDGPGMLATLAAVALAWGFLVAPFVIQKHSMEPGLLEDDRVLVWKRGVSASMAAGTIVILEDDKGDVVVKRVVGRGGETVEIVNGDVLIDGRVLVEPDDAREAMRVPLVRSEFRDGRGEDWGPVAGVPGVLRYHAPLAADAPRGPGEGYGASPDAHDVYVEARFADGSATAGPAGVAIEFDAGGAPVTPNSAFSLVRDPSGRLVLTQGALPFGEGVALATFDVGRDSPLTLAFVDGRVRVGDRAVEPRDWPSRPAGRARVYVRGPVRSVAIDRDVHYLDHLGPYGTDPGYAVPEGRVFVLGDHSVNSRDSRMFGAVSVKKVIGRVFFRLWPLSRVGRVR